MIKAMTMMMMKSFQNKENWNTEQKNDEININEITRHKIHIKEINTQWN